jgi:DNA-binding winged helix-turn-helix (wHTH) protein
MADRPPCSGVVRFGAFEVDGRTRELRKDSVRIRLQEQPFQVLEALLERPGQLVTRDDLRQRIWPADTFVDFDHGLYSAMARLREALGDSAESPRFIETLARRGYRFVAPVVRDQADVQPATTTGDANDRLAARPAVSSPAVHARPPMALLATLSRCIRDAQSRRS